MSVTLAEGLCADLAYGFKTDGHPYFNRYRLNRQIDLDISPRWALLRQQKLIMAFSSTDIPSNYDIALYSGAYSPLAAIRGGARRNFLYCHTPPRFAYDLNGFYLSRFPRWQRPLVESAIARFRDRYEKAVAAMDIIITNSENVRSRIRTQIGRDAQVVHPPCDTQWFQWLGQADYYLSTARLDPLKRVDLIIQAFKMIPDRKLVIVSDGPDLPRLQRLAGTAPNIRFAGQVSELRLRELLGNAIATLYLPMDEDFGMSPVESMAAGKPIIGVKEGGLLETVVNGDTGVLLDTPPSAESVAEEVSRMTSEHARSLRWNCEKRAALFSRERFLERMRMLLDQG